MVAPVKLEVPRSKLRSGCSSREEAETSRQKSKPPRRLPAVRGYSKTVLFRDWTSQ